VYKADYDILTHIDSLSEGQLLYYSNCYLINNLRHYVNVQYTWMEEAKYFAGLNLNHSPTQIEFIEHWNLHRNAERFRAYYVIKYPDNVSMLEPEYCI
jgi:hypothetical protein